jgi:hypothetical protein
MSRTTFLDFDIVLINLQSVLQLLAIGQRSGRESDISWRRAEIHAMLETGRTIIVSSCQFPMTLLFPLRYEVNVSNIEGREMVFVGPDIFRQFWNSISNFAVYRARWRDGALGDALLTLRGFEDNVGSWLRHESGNVIFLPMLSFPTPADAGRFVDAVIKLAERLSPKPEKLELPKWTLNFTWPRLVAFQSELNRIRQEVEKMIASEKSALGQLISEESLKILIAGKGPFLEEQVIETLREIGFKAEKGEPGRDDVILEWNGRPAVAEIKGKEKSAAEKDAAQLEKWVSIQLEKTGSAPKGILIVNAFCDTPPSERKLSAFPDQMLKYSQGREHCLITTLQLLGLLLEIRQNPGKRGDLIEGIFNTSGIYRQFTDYDKFLQLCR